ncbi:O-GlcNAc transferase, C-terminal,Tetratricopeptide repeat,Tetratricopeptide repeat [Cinara cedri]|uniref:protein O-GlcNAc transferase n=1 Tax=Cinara cedri TaxID=506608 RepID=A0A5E4NLA9_9HEMI|nr:O-GlcNAc transferase, C-terminal,Tetratricopeptide repeat,Tetratricopeptide repeat [Cinara cedri]
MDLFCERYVDSEDSIFEIAKILSNDDSKKLRLIMKKFKSLGFHKVKDLARTTLAKFSKFSVSNYSLPELFNAMKIYHENRSKQFNSIKALYIQSNYVSCQNECEKVLEIHPDDLNIVILLSASYYMQGKYEESSKLLLNLPEKHHDCPEVTNNLGAINFQNSHYLEACNNYYSAVTKRPDFVGCWLSYILTLINMQSYVNAIKSLNMIVLSKPSLFEGFTLLGHLLLKLKRFDEASFSFRYALALRPECYTSWLGLADSFGCNKKCNGAIVCYEKALELNRSLKRPFLGIGYMLFQLRRFDEAINYLKIALLEGHPNMYKKVLPVLGHAYFYNNNMLSAMKTYFLYLKIQPNNPVVLHDMGLIFISNIHNTVSVDPCFNLCINLEKRNALYYKSFISVYRQLNKEDLASKKAIKCFEKHMFKDDYISDMSVLKSDSLMFPEYYYPHWNLGLMFIISELDNKALMRYDDAKKMKPNFFLTFSNIAYMYEKDNLLQEAEQFYEKAVEVNPKHCYTIRKLITLKHRKGLIDDVIGLYDLMLKHSTSGHLEIYKELANYFYNEVGNLREAYNNFKKASEICDDDFDIYLNLGTLSLKLSDHNDAFNYFRKALELNPNCIFAHLYTGYIYKERKQFKRAIRQFKKLLGLQPSHPDAYSFLIMCLQYTCKFTHLDEMSLNKLRDVIFQQLANNEVPSILLRQTLLCNFEPEVLTRIASALANQYVDKQYVQRSLYSKQVYNISLSNSCIRIGYIYLECSSHPTLELLNSFIKLHDRSSFELFCYSLSSLNILRSNNLPAPDCCVDISKLSPIDSAKKINADGIHILIEVGDSIRESLYDIFVLKPAPIQAKLLGHPGTSGATFIDYLITDEQCSPPNLDCLYTEKLAYLKRSVFFGDHMLFYNDLSQRNFKIKTKQRNRYNKTMGTFESHNTSSIYITQTFPDRSVKHYTRLIYNVPEDSVVYCYFGQLYKINQTTLNMWITILKGVKNSVLWLLRFAEDAEKNIRDYVVQNGFPPERIIFSDIIPKDEHLRRIQLADICLDTPLYNGHKSCLDALWAGTPIITLSGITFASRIATSQLTAMKCTNLIAINEEDYIKKAIKLGTNGLLLEKIRQHIWRSKKTSELFDCKSYCNKLENLYIDLWKNYSDQCI